MCALRVRSLFSRTFGARLLGVGALLGCLMPGRASAAPTLDCSTPALIAAIVAANASPGADVLDLAPSCTYALTPSDTLPDVTSVITLAGHGARLLWSFGTPGWHVTNTGQLTLQDLTLEGAYYSGPGGALYNQGGLTVSGCTFVNNQATAAYDENAGSGGAIYNTGTLTVSTSRFLDNAARYGGGAILNAGTATVDDSIFDHNHTAVGGGGAVRNRAGANLTMRRCVLNNNNSGGGGGLSNAGDLVLQESQVLSNTAPIGGGLQSTGSADLLGVLFAYNRAFAATGGAVDNEGVFHAFNTTFGFNEASGNGGALASRNEAILVSSTLAQNSAAQGSEVANGGGNVWLYNTIVAGGDAGQNCSGAIGDGGNNIDSGASCAFVSTLGSISGTNPQLAPLQDNGGQTPTFALLPGSPAIDGIGYNPPNYAPAFDQRYLTRSLPYDIGAYEYECADADGDALCDAWESGGIDVNGDGAADLQLYDVDGNGVVSSSERADPNHKDIYVEVDWMERHRPDDAAVAALTAAFAAAPVSNPDGQPGIRLHIQLDEQAVSHNNVLAMQGCTAAASAGVPDFDIVKSGNSGTPGHFGTASERLNPQAIDAKRLVFHYALFVHGLLGLGTVTGCGEFPGNDFVVSLGAVAGNGTDYNGTVRDQAGTFMHELGHNLRLGHGGGDPVNCKPNYLSVMSYARQLQYPLNFPLDYSRTLLPTLNITSLSEPLGIGASSAITTLVGPPAASPVTVVSPAQSVLVGSNWLILTPANVPIDWNRDGDAADLSVRADVANLGIFGCQGGATALAGYNDWSNLQFNLRASYDSTPGVRETPHPEPELEIDAVMQPLTVTADLWPGDNRGEIDLYRDVTVSIAILSDDTVMAAAIDPLSLRFGPDAAADADGMVAWGDVNGDGRMDWTWDFAPRAAGLRVGDTQVCLAGSLTSGQPLYGCIQATVIDTEPAARTWLPIIGRQ